MNVSEFQVLLERHDWFYAHSDDYTCWSKGSNERIELQNLCRNDIELKRLFEKKFDEVYQ